jgi:hypothetical protein
VSGKRGNPTHLPIIRFFYSHSSALARQKYQKPEDDEKETKMGA